MRRQMVTTVYNNINNHDIFSHEFLSTLFFFLQETEFCPNSWMALFRSIREEMI